MKRLLVISDTHGHLEAARTVISEHGPWDHIIHLGDSILDAVDLSLDLDVDIAGVRGNNEYPDSPELDDVLVFEAGGVRFYAVHGHELDINPWDKGYEESIEELASRALKKDAKVALFGHSHISFNKDVGGVRMINPGGMGLGDSEKTYAEIVVSDSGGIEVLIKRIS